MRKFLVAAAILGGSVVSASAANMMPTYSWTGAYIGVQGGWASGEANHTIITDGFGFLNEPFGPTDIDGWTYGALIGYDRQVSPNWVFGINFEINGGKIEGVFDNGPPQGFGLGGDDVYQSEVHWYGAIRGKVGYVIPSLPQIMLYATGGLAFARIEAANGDGLGGFSLLDDRQASGSSTEWGYTLGAGLSWMIPGTQLVLSGEGAYYDFGTARINTVTNTGVTHVFDVDTKFWTARGVLTYRF